MVRVVAVGRLGVSPRSPRPTSCVQEGDVLYLAVAGDALAPLDARLAGPAEGRPLMRVVIAGGGSVGRFIAEQLPRGRPRGAHHRQRPRASCAGHERSGEPDGRRRGSRPTPARSSRLAEAELDEADVVAAVTGDDEDNLVISLLAKQEFGVPRVVARVNNPKNEWMFNEMWGVDVAVSTPHLSPRSWRRP